jgi:hypothetical protein
MDITANHIADSVVDRLQALADSGDLAFVASATRADYIEALKDKSISHTPGVIVYAVPGQRTTRMPGKNWTSVCGVVIVVASASSQQAHHLCNTAELAVFKRLRKWRVPSGDAVTPADIAPQVIIEGDIYAVITNYQSTEIIEINP